MNTYFEQKAAAQSFEEYALLVNGAVGTADLMELIRFDPGAVLRNDPAAKAFKMANYCWRSADHETDDRTRS